MPRFVAFIVEFKTLRLSKVSLQPLIHIHGNHHPVAPVAALVYHANLAVLRDVLERVKRVAKLFHLLSGVTRGARAHGLEPLRDGLLPLLVFGHRHRHSNVSHRGGFHRRRRSRLRVVLVMPRPGRFLLFL